MINVTEFWKTDYLRTFHNLRDTNLSRMQRASLVVKTVTPNILHEKSSYIIASYHYIVFFKLLKCCWFFSVPVISRN